MWLNTRPDTPVASLSTVHVITSCMHQWPEINCDECKIHEQQLEVL